MSKGIGEQNYVDNSNWILSILLLDYVCLVTKKQVVKDIDLVPFVFLKNFLNCLVNPRCIFSK